MHMNLYQFYYQRVFQKRKLLAHEKKTVIISLLLKSVTKTKSESTL